MILIHIQNFFYIILLSVAGFAVPFFLLGNNQSDFDNLDKDDLASIEYKSWYGSLIYTYHLAFGDFNFDVFSLGDKSQYYQLWVLFYISSFTLLIHFLNMLIAIMGEVILNDEEIKRKLLLKTKLAFILDTWWGNPLKSEK
tara:strand:+ start:297 stop:719 length:423 start_codon:yes stop_codon:yes gene_type:complete